MSESNRFADTLGLDFTCLAEPPEPDCPAEQGDFQFNDETGNYVCPLCLHTVGGEAQDLREDLFDEEDDPDAGPMDEGKDFIAEGDKIQDFSPDFNKRIARENTIDELSTLLHPSDPSLALFIAKHRNEIVDQLRTLESTDHPAFREGKWLNSKIIAVASHLRGVPPSRATLVKHKINATATINLYTLLNKLLSPHKEVESEMQFMNIGRLIGMPDSLVRAAIEEYELHRPIIRTIDPYARIVAWLYVMGKKYEWKITQGKVIKLAGSKRNATREAIREYTDFLSNIKGAKENPSPYGLKRKSHLE